ncbi:uncharacterized protein BT62DRAFT_980427 [Guyanagaster necrorhizus]|uniref:Uncharacterized protein n=1 Tax=Guyanagaster necrorhizus TaxID=856835 RepID=A0A9P7VUN8_9AGAR|nr:uncharacterized protein BT62DRAFT_980427 [Guyanagaster necrorhizus MCA 3950]KAG7446790.1 hypothetical protein BT62DRAFT_980427 [Guyanagaster necrorhizus MCA 3950]
MTGRIVLSSYESLRAAGTSIICLSPWGDSSPLSLPCIRFRDIAVHTVIAATGGMAAVAAPVMGPVSDLVVGSLGDSILVEIGVHTGFETTTKIANDLIIDKTLKHIIPIHSKMLETTNVKSILITLKFKQTMEDAALGFFRSSVHKDPSLFSSVIDYFSVDKGWFSPYLFASSRRPIIPRTMQPDVLFCHGPFLEGDYKIGETLLKESASVIILTSAPLSGVKTIQAEEPSRFSLSNLNIPSLSLSNLLSRSRSPSPSPESGKGAAEGEPTPQLTPLPVPPSPRRMVIVLMGLKPHRKLWTTSARPGESVINYILFNGCPAIVVPVKVGAPLLAWDALTLEELWKIELPPEGGESQSGQFEGIVSVLYEFLDLCVDWKRIILDEESSDCDEEEGRNVLKVSLTLLLAAAVRSKDSKEVVKEVDKERSGFAMWRIP